MTISMNGGCFAYKSSPAPIFRDVSFSVGKGDMLAILGPNGAGKTTLIKCIAGLLPLSSGQSLLDGADIRTIPARKLWQHIAYVPQAKGAAVSCTAEEMVLLGRSSRIGVFRSPGVHDREVVRQTMERLGISSLAPKRCSEMSGGELQMVLIARALAAQPEILILDEPESNLDFRNQLIVLDAMSSLAADGMTCIFNTHYPAHALRRANYSLLLQKDGTYQFGETPQVVTERSIGSAFGVKAVIGSIETPEAELRDVIPLSVDAGNGAPEEPDTEERVIAVVSIITASGSRSEEINRLLHEVQGCIIGRMGMPYHSAGLFIINVTLDGPRGTISGLTARLSQLPGVSVKATYAKAEEGRP